MLFLATILIGQIVFISVPHTKGFALASFTIDPPSYAFQGPGSKDFTVTATLPGGSGTNGVNVYLKPEADRSHQVHHLYVNPLYIQPNLIGGTTMIPLIRMQ